MKSQSVVVTRTGGPEVLAARVTDLPQVPPGHARLRVVSAGVSYGDVLARAGVIPGGPKAPYVPGFDVTGQVVDRGPGVDLPVGRTMTALVRQGAYADLADVQAERLVPVPEGLEPTVCAAGILDTFIAWQMLHRVARVRAGGRVLVHGASGGVGRALVQLAVRHGAEVYGTCSAARAQVVREDGAVPLDYTTDFVAGLARRVPAGVDAVFDHIGGVHFLRSYRCLARPGVLVAFGQDSALRRGRRFMLNGVIGFLGGIVAPKLLPDGRRTVFYNAWSLEPTQPLAYREDMTRVLDLMASGTVRPRLGGTYPLSSAVEVHRLLESRRHDGKLVLVPAALVSEKEV